MPLTSTSLAPVEEMIHGTLVRDPYRWLEDRSLPETEEWIREQQIRCDTYFAECEDLPAIRERVRDYLDVETMDQPSRIGSKYFYRRRNRGQEQASIYIQDTTTGKERLLVDASPLGKFASVGVHRISEDGSLLAYELKVGGGDRKAVYVAEVEGGRAHPNFLGTGYARGFTFATSNQGFYACHEGSHTSREHTIKFCRLDKRIDDRVCFRVTNTPGSRLVLIADRTHLGAIHSFRKEGSGVIDLWIARRSEPETWRQVITKQRLPFSPILRQGRIFALSFEHAPNGKVVELNHAGKEVRIVIPEQDRTVRQVVLVGNKIFLNCLHKMVPSLEGWSLDSEKFELLDIPEGGTIQLIAPQSEVAESIFYTYESFSRPPIIFEHRLDAGEARAWHSREMHQPVPGCYLRETAFPSKDGVRIPLTIASSSKAEIEQRPVILTGYGGFGVPATPQYSVLVAIMMDLGATFVVAHIRGGGEFGKDWHDAARGRNRQVAVDDFISGAEWMIGKGIASADQLAICGGSNSGLLVGGAMTQRPDIFRAVLCLAPLLDMVRYERFDQAVKWREEYGTVDDPEDFAALYAGSPYHQIAEGIDYPSVLFVSGDQDDRCNPAHVRKMAARLQRRSAQSSPILVDYSEERGHSPVLPLSVRVEALARRISFLCRELGLAARGHNDTPCI